jgi:hypothetical protein
MRAACFRKYRSGGRRVFVAGSAERHGDPERYVQARCSRRATEDAAMGNQSRQTPQDNRQQAMGGGQPMKGDDKELRGGKAHVPHGSGDRNSNESMREEGFEHAAKKKPDAKR